MAVVAGTILLRTYNAYLLESSINSALKHNNRRSTMTTRLAYIKRAVAAADRDVHIQLAQII